MSFLKMNSIHLMFDLLSFSFGQFCWTQINALMYCYFTMFNSMSSFIPDSMFDFMSGSKSRLEVHINHFHNLPRIAGPLT